MFFLRFLFLLFWVFCFREGLAQEKPVSTTQRDVPTAYSFRPLLIQGKKQMKAQAKDMKVESGSIAESQLFFVDVDFKKRIFESELKE